MSGERWLNNKEIKCILKPDAAGPVLLYENGKAYAYDGEGHIGILGVSGSGKSRRLTYPLVNSLIRNKESIYIVDPKAELWSILKSSIPSDYEVHVIDFRNLFEEDVEGWNPLRAPYELWKNGSAKGKYIAEQMIEELSCILFSESLHSDVFWPHSARSVFLGCTYAVFETARPEEVNLSSVFNMIAQGDERYGSSSYLKEYMKILDEGDLKNKENITMQLQSYVSTAEDTRGGIRSVFMDGLAIATKSESIRRYLSKDGLNINALRGDKPIIVFNIIPEETSNFYDLGGVLISQTMSHFIRMAEQDYNGKLKIRLNFVIEEAGNVARAIPNLDHYLAASRSRNIRVAFVLQAFSQLDAVYGKAKAQTILANADCLIAFRTINRETLEELSYRCGNKEVLRDGHPYMEPLCTPCQLSQLETGQALVLIRGRKFITWLPDYSEMSISHYRPEKTATVAKAKKTKVAYFNIKDFVKKAKAKGIGCNSDSRLDSALPKEFKDLPRLSVDELIKGLEEDSRKLEKEMSEAIEQTERKTKQNKTYRVYVNCIFIDKSTADDIAKIISTQTSEDYEIVRAKVIDKQVFDYEFKTLKEARSFISKIKNAGADAWLE